MARLTESTVEQAAPAWLEAIGWQVAHVPGVAPDTLLAEGQEYGEVILARRLRDALLPKLLSGKIDVSALVRLAKEPAQAGEVGS